MPRIGRKRLTVDIPHDLHIELKTYAKLCNCTITRIVSRLIKKKLLEIQAINKGE